MSAVLTMLGAKIKAVLRHIFSRQFLIYVVSGFASTFIDIGLFYTLIWFDLWYLAAQAISGLTGFLSAFVLHKYCTFGVRSQVHVHFFRFCILGLFNLAAVSAILYLLVDVLEVSEYLAKIPANGSVVLWNFFLYKFLVYV